MHQAHKHIRTQGVYHVLYLATFLAVKKGKARDMEDVLVMRGSHSHMAVQMASDPPAAGYEVVAGGRLQKSDALKLLGGEAMVVYVGAEGNVWARERDEFDARFDPPLALPTPTAPPDEPDFFEE